MADRAEMVGLCKMFMITLEVNRRFGAMVT